ncbi:MAG TPA: hypothetical protein VIS29_16920, partial [Streptomyces sp.]
MLIEQLRGLELFQWLWPQFEALGSRDETGLAVAAAGRLLSGDGAERKTAGELGPADLPGLSDQARKLVGQALELGRREGPAETYEFLLRRWLDVNVRQISTTPEPLAELMTDLALLVRARGQATGDDDGALTVLDPACGTGHLLAAAPAGTPATLIGCDRDPVLAALAGARLALR